jgi:hypothetical protein
VSLGTRDEIHLCVRPSAEVDLMGRRAWHCTEPIADHGAYLAWSSGIRIVHMSAEQATVIRQARFNARDPAGDLLGEILGCGR